MSVQDLSSVTNTSFARTHIIPSRFVGSYLPFDSRDNFEISKADYIAAATKRTGLRSTIPTSELFGIVVFLLEQRQPTTQ